MDQRVSMARVNVWTDQIWLASKNGSESKYDQSKCMDRYNMARK